MHDQSVATVLFSALQAATEALKAASGFAMEP